MKFKKAIIQFEYYPDYNYNHLEGVFASSREISLLFNISKIEKHNHIECDDCVFDITINPNNYISVSNMLNDSDLMLYWIIQPVIDPKNIFGKVFNQIMKIADSDNFKRTLKLSILNEI